VSRTEMPLLALHRPRMFGPDTRVARDLGHGLHENGLIDPSRQGHGARSLDVSARVIFQTFGCLGSPCCCLVIKLLAFVKYGGGRMKSLRGVSHNCVAETGWPTGQSLARRWPVPCAATVQGYVFFERLARLASGFRHVGHLSFAESHEVQTSVQNGFLEVDSAKKKAPHPDSLTARPGRGSERDCRSPCSLMGSPILKVIRWDEHTDLARPLPRRTIITECAGAFV